MVVPTRIDCEGRRRRLKTGQKCDPFRMIHWYGTGTLRRKRERGRSHRSQIISEQLTSTRPTAKSADETFY